MTGSATTDFGALDVAPARFVARRTAWHAVDHAWEIQDKQES